MLSLFFLSSDLSATETPLCFCRFFFVCLRCDYSKPPPHWVILPLASLCFVISTMPSTSSSISLPPAPRKKTTLQKKRRRKARLPPLKRFLPPSALDYFRISPLRIGLFPHQPLSRWLFPLASVGVGFPSASLGVGLFSHQPPSADFLRSLGLGFPSASLRVGFLSTMRGLLPHQPPSGREGDHDSGGRSKRLIKIYHLKYILKTVETNAKKR